jgi:APA family basic amino acid/polyamine antiporter
MPEAGPSTEEESAPPPMPAGFGLATATFVIVSSMIGVGILTTSGLIVDLVGSNSLMLGLWAVGGGIALCGALSLAELAAMLPRSGGEYVFLHEAYGPRLAFLSGWAAILIGFAAPIAAASWSAAAYLLTPLPIARWAVPWARIGLGSACIVAFASIHATTRRRTARTQGLVTTLELTFLVGFVVAGLIAGRSGWRNLHYLPTIDAARAGKLLFSLVLVSYGYTGWNAAAYLAGEVGDAPRRLPRAILLGTVGVTALYLGMNLVYALALSADDVRAIVRDEGKTAIEPIAGRAALVLFGPRWSGPFSVAVGLILLATTSAFLLTGPRVMFAMAREGHFPAVAARLSARHGTPSFATLILSGLALILLWTGSFDAIVIFAGIGLALSSMLSVAAVYVLRVRRPELPRPFRVPLYPFVPGVYLLGTAIIVGAVFVQEPLISTLSTASLLAALPAYDLWMRWASRKPGGLAAGAMWDIMDIEASGEPPSGPPTPPLS